MENPRNGVPINMSINSDLTAHKSSTVFQNCWRLDNMNDSGEGPSLCMASSPSIGSSNDTEMDVDIDNERDNEIKNSSHLKPATSTGPAGHSLYSLCDFVELDLASKGLIVSAFIPTANLADLRKFTTLHYAISAQNGKKKKTMAELRAEFKMHVCSQICLVRREHAVAAGLIDAPTLGEDSFLSSARSLKLRTKARSPTKKRPAALDPQVDEPRPAKRQKTRHIEEYFQRASDLAHPVEEDRWLHVLSPLEKLEILQDYFDATSNEAIKRYECSFCGARQPASSMSLIPCSQLDISLLKKAVDELRFKTRQPAIQAFRDSTIQNSCYRLCSLCKREVQHHRFTRIPVRSYANGLWTGDVPEELRDLTFLEEQCIARARTTKCMFKLEMGPSGQFASRGNVCILPQDPSPLSDPTSLPPPLSSLHDEISVVFVGSPETEVTVDMLCRTPLLVRRSKIVCALNWLKFNNPLYADLDLDAVATNSQEYPENGIPIPVQNVIKTTSSSGEGSSYTHQADEEAFTEEVSPRGMPSSTVVDADNITSTYKMRKLQAIERLKSGSESFVKYPSGSIPEHTRRNPKVFGHLWPTLFPYGVGMMENDDVREDDSVGFRTVDMRTHISHLLLSGSDRRFETHLSYMFVVYNILQRRTTSYNARLAVNRSWFPRVDSLFNMITESTVNEYSEKLKNNPFARPETDGERAAAQLMKYVNYVGDHVPGSITEIQNMREEMFSIVNTNGLPHVFLTLNPSDTNSPIAQVLAGRDVDLDKFFHDLSPSSENMKRSSFISKNPVAGAEFFHTCVTNMLEKLLGTGRKDRKGVFGEVEVYYGVVEAQGRGRLHIHLLIWLKGGLSPIEMKKRCESDPQFAEKLTKWYDDVFSRNMPENTVPYERTEGMYKRQPVMSRSMNPRDPNFWELFNQDLRDIIENAGMVHSHNSTCFKHLPKNLRALRDDDKDCRFLLPRDIVEKTHFDEDGNVVLRCNDGYVNGHNPLIMVAERCNMDAKPIGCGTVAMAMFQYMGNYTIKSSMDTAFVFSALCASIKVLSTNTPMSLDGVIDSDERSRQLMVKTVNHLIGKREMSSQQIACALINNPNHYTNRAYPVFFWSGMLRDLARSVFQEEKPAISDDNSGQDKDGNQEGDIDSEDNLPERQTISPHEDDSYVFLTKECLGVTHASNDANEDEIEEKIARKTMLFNDIFFRPPELKDMCAWDIMCLYAKEKLPKSKTQIKTYLRFSPSHPQYSTHCMKKITDTEKPRVPVLKGYSIPRRTSEDQRIKYAVVILTLFKPWASDESSPLKDQEVPWIDACESLIAGLNQYHLKVIENMQLLHESRDAKQDYSAQRRQRRGELAALMGGSHFTSNGDDDPNDQYDPAWEEAMQATVDLDSLAETNFDYEECSPDVANIIVASKSHGFFDVRTPDNNISRQYANSSQIATEDDYEAADHALINILRERETLMKGRSSAVARSRQKIQGLHRRMDIEVPLPFSTTILQELEQARLRFERFHPEKPGGWTELLDWQQLAVMLCDKYNLNDRQRLAFLLLADCVGRQLASEAHLEPFRMLVTGPGGTGKSQIFKAWSEFHRELDISGDLRLTAPTGVVASDIGGSTIHSEAALRVKRENMKADTPGGRKIRSELEERLGLLRTLIVDEIYFMEPTDISLLNEYSSMARGILDHPFGALNIVTCGDPAQLPPPGAPSLFDRELVRCFETNRLNALNEKTQYKVKGIQAWHQVDHAVELTEIMRQKGDDILIDILGRLRTGTCTSEDKELLDKHVLSNPECSQETRKLTDITRWISDPSNACPLITYTNAARDAHNFESAKAFAGATGQEFVVYHSTDTRGAKKNRRELKGGAAEAAWKVPVKKAKDLGGKVPLIPGMPVFGTENIAPELGISKGSQGTLVSVKYSEKHGRRYAVSATVDFQGYVGKNKDHPHRVTLKPSSQSFKFKLPNSSREYTASRSQIPLIPAFACTSHNAQGRSMNTVCVDLASCRSIQSAYVMLSRVRSLKGLCILRPFNLKKVQNHISEELRNELKRTTDLSVKTAQWAQVRLEWYTSRFGPLAQDLVAPP